MVESRGNVSFAVDLKKGRIRIHKTTLYELGEPPYIQLLINPNKRQIVIRALESKVKDAHYVSLSSIKPDYCIELYSKGLIATLAAIIPQIDSEATYKLFGRVFKEKGIAVFSLDSIEKVM